jgi:hypothetical protein
MMEDASLPKTLAVGCLLWMLGVLVVAVGGAFAVGFFDLLFAGGY